MNEAIKFVGAFRKHVKLFQKTLWYPVIMLKMVVFSNGGRLSFVSIYVPMQVPTCIPHISCITQVTFKFVYYTLLVDNGGLGLIFS